MSHIVRDGQTIDIVTFGEALRRLGMDGRVRNAAQFHDDLVAYVPRVVADAGTGRLFAFCGGRVLYSFCGMAKASHLPDESWAWRETNRGVDVVVCTEPSIAGDSWLEAVRPA